MSDRGSIPELDKRPLSPIKQVPEPVEPPVAEEAPETIPEPPIEAVNNEVISAKPRPTSAEIKGIL